MSYTKHASGRPEVISVGCWGQYGRRPAEWLSGRMKGRSNTVYKASPYCSGVCVSSRWDWWERWADGLILLRGGWCEVAGCSHGATYLQTHTWPHNPRTLPITDPPLPPFSSPFSNLHCTCIFPFISRAVSPLMDCGVSPLGRFICDGTQRNNSACRLTSGIVIRGVRKCYRLLLPMSCALQ